MLRKPDIQAVRRGRLERPCCECSAACHRRVDDVIDAASRFLEDRGRTTILIEWFRNRLVVPLSHSTLSPLSGPTAHSTGRASGDGPPERVLEQALLSRFAYRRPHPRSAANLCLRTRRLRLLLVPRQK